MFSSALKSLTSNISSNYSIAQQPSSVSGPWKIYDAKKRSTGKAVSVFVFDRRSLEPQQGSFGGRTGAASLKKAHDEVVERLKKEASSLARLRHPNILELAEPVEETRSGGLIFATEPVTASLAGLLQGRDEQEQTGGPGGRGSRYMVEEPDGKKRRREVEVDELEIQKGLLQIGKGLEFLHESARLVHANLTPDAIFVNAKSDWKISGLGFCTPPDDAGGSTTASIQLSEVLDYDSRLPRSVQLNIDYTSPDFVMDNNINTSADMFSLGLIIIALYNSPHRSPIDSSYSLSTYKRTFSSSATIPTQNNNYLASGTIPRDVSTSLLPRLITRRPAQRYTAREFQQAQYFDNILVSTIRFLDSLPAKTLNEKSQFMRGLPRILPQFPKSVLEKKVLPALLEEMKDADLLSLILQNVFKIIELATNGKRAFSEQVVPRLRSVFAPGGQGKNTAHERDSAKEGGLLMLLENMTLITTNCSGKEFKDDILPIVFLALESPTHSLQDASLQSLPTLLPVLDFSTIKNELFPAVAHVFSKTSSMAIKIRGLEGLNILCGGIAGETTLEDSLGDSSLRSKSSYSSGILDKYTVQEKVVPLLKVIKTKEPAVMMAALNVFKQVARVADTDFLALDALPVLWQFSLGPLLNLEQFQAFMELIKSISSRIEDEHTRKLKDLSTGGGRGAMASARVGSPRANGMNNEQDDGDFETLVTGRKAGAVGSDFFDNGWGDERSSSHGVSQPRLQSQPAQIPTFSWSSTASDSSGKLNSNFTFPAQQPQQPMSRTVTPDVNLSGFTTLTPSKAISNSTGYFSQPLQPHQPTNKSTAFTSTTGVSGGSTVDWSSALNSTNAWATPQKPTAPPLQPALSPGASANWGSSASTMPSQIPSLSSAFSNFGISAPSAQSNPWQTQPSGHPSNAGSTGTNNSSHSQRQGLDKYDSLL